MELDIVLVLVVSIALTIATYLLDQLANRFGGFWGNIMGALVVLNVAGDIFLAALALYAAFAGVVITLAF